MDKYRQLFQGKVSSYQEYNEDDCEDVRVVK